MNKDQTIILACRDDEAIIRRMKKVGIWEPMKENSRLGETITILRGSELFIWLGLLGDSGYVYFKSDNPAELLVLAAQALSNPIAGSPTKNKLN
jgi:hypothetical protein